MQGPPPADLIGFPRVRRDDVYFRVARREPWWFCTCGECRFDLTGCHVSGHGTMYVGTDALTGVLEMLGPELSGATVSSAFLAERTIWVLGYDRPLHLCDLTDRRALAFGVTNELSAMTPYPMPQQWAERFDDHGADGIVYRTRFDTGPTATGVALFDDAGEHAWPKTMYCRGDAPEIVAALAASGIAVEAPPPASALTFLTESS